MLKIKLSFLAALSCLAFVAPAYADKSAGQQVDDTTLSGSVKAKLIDTKGVPSTAINVEVSKGRVQLGGFLESEAEKKAALEAAKSVSGVTKVYDGLVVIKKDRSAGQLMSGFMHGKGDRKQFEDVAKGIKGVKHVYNKIELE